MDDVYWTACRPVLWISSTLLRLSTESDRVRQAPRKSGVDPQARTLRRGHSAVAPASGAPRGNLDRAVAVEVGR